MLFQLFGSDSVRRAAEALGRGRMLYFIYAGRLTVCLAVFGSALAVGEGWILYAAGILPPERETLRTISLAGLVLAGVATPAAYWYSHLSGRDPGKLFLYSQVVLDILLVTAIVHITGGIESIFPPLLYIVLASGYALVLPFTPALLVALCTGAAYLAEIAAFYPSQLGAGVLVQIGIFTVVASTSSVIGGRLRQMRAEVRRLEGELHRLRLEAADILRSVGSGVMTLDHEGRLAYMNPAAEELLDVDADGWLGEEMFPELARRAPGIAAAVRETLRDRQEVRNRESEVRRAGEGTAPVSVTTTYLEGTGGPPSVTMALQDLRPARRLEELRLRTGRLEAVAELSASLAHEIRNPLASIRSAAQQLREVAEEGGEEGLLTGLVVRESDRLATLLEEFGDFAQVSVADRRPVDLERLGRRVLEVVRHHPDTPEGAELTLEMEGRAEGLWGDPDLLNRLLFNLCLNAVQAAEPGRPPTVRVVVDELRPDLQPRDVSLGSPVRIRVVDDGPGIPAEEQRRIFDPFYSRRKGGSGLGLSIAHRAAEAHGGALFVSSTPGEGTTFVLVLPRRGEARDQQDEPEPVPHHSEVPT